MKKSRLGYGICLVVLVLLYGLLMACQNQEKVIEESEQQSSIPQQIVQEESSMVVEISQPVETKATVTFEVKAGDYLTQILSDLVGAGWGESEEALLLQLEAMQQERSSYEVWSMISNPEERAFAAEGYIAPGCYEWGEDATTEEVLALLLASWDDYFTQDMIDQALQQGYTVDEVLIMASIVEWESSFDPYNIVKPNVAAVVRNRIESDTPLQMDVTIFYLQEALEPYRDPQLYEDAYDTYIRSTLPAGPIGSPGLDSIQAVLNPADTQDLFFVYDEEGNYYFAEDYDQHLINCQTAGIY